MAKVKPKQRISMLAMDNQIKLGLVLQKLPALITCDKAWIIQDIRQALSNSAEIDKLTKKLTP